MPVMKVQLLFGQAKWGWSETYYYNYGGATFLNIEEPVKRLATARSGMLGIGPNLEGARVSFVGKPHVVLNLPASVFTLINYQANAAAPWEVMLTRWWDVTNEYSRLLYIRGMPDSWMPVMGTGASYMNFTLPSIAQQAFDRFRFVLTGRSTPPDPYWAGQEINKDPNAVKENQITAVSIDSTLGTFAVTVEGDSTWINVGDRVRVSGAKGVSIKGLNGTHKVLAKAGPLVTLNHTQKCKGIPALYEIPVIKNLLYVYPILTQGKFVRFVKRDVGAPFFGTAGAVQSSRC